MGGTGAARSEMRRPKTQGGGYKNTICYGKGFILVRGYFTYFNTIWPLTVLPNMGEMRLSRTS